MAWEPRRDLIGYASAPPDPQWPGGARLAVNFVLNYEEGSEPSIQDGDGYTESLLTEGRGFKAPGRNLAAEGMFEYGSRVGFWRVHRTFERAGVPLTVFGCALALERNPEAAAAIAETGWDVCSHGWRWIDHMALDEDTERDHIAKAVASIEATTGARPLGWYCRYGPGVNTRRLLVAEGGFTYDSDCYNDELPYWTDVDGTDHLVVPYTMVTNDGQFYTGMGTGEQWLGFVTDAFDLLYREGADQPKMMSIGLHNRIIGQPARAAALERLLDHIAGHDDVWLTRRIDIAEHWISTHPAPG